MTTAVRGLLFSFLALAVVRCVSSATHISTAHFVYDASGVVVWVSPCFHETIYVPAGNGCNNPTYMQFVETGIGALLQSGQLDPVRLYAAFPASRAPAELRSRRLKRLDAVFAYEGPLVKVLNVTETIRDDGHGVVIKLEATTSRFEDGWGSVDFIEITVFNPAVSARAERQAYFATARVADVRYAGTML